MPKLLIDLTDMTEIIERHNHSNERWYEVATTPIGETHVADRLGDNGGTTFQIDAGDNDWGDWLQILGSEDTPTVTSNNNLDLHKILITGVERTALYDIQIACGETGAGALADGTYTEFPFKASQVGGKEQPLIFKQMRTQVRCKIWARCKCPGYNTATMNFLFGLHEYPR
jgi:hypothetical protein